MKFKSRQDAGQKLGQYLRAAKIQFDVVLGLPRGGVLVAAEVANLFACALDVLVVRKIGHPQFREFAVGALAEGNIAVLDQEVLARAQVNRDDLNEIIAEESERLVRYREKFRLQLTANLTSKSVAVIDDGLATGATTEAAVRSVRQKGAAKIIVAVPVASENGFARLARISDQMMALTVDPQFEAVGQYYWSFPQTTDDEVIEVLRRQNNTSR